MGKGTGMDGIQREDQGKREQEKLEEKTTKILPGLTL